MNKILYKISQLLLYLANTDMYGNPRPKDMISYREEQILKRICERIVIQGPEHEGNIEQYYRMMYEIARKEFCEDTTPSFDSYMSERFKAAMKSKEE